MYYCREKGYFKRDFNKKSFSSFFSADAAAGHHAHCMAYIASRSRVTGTFLVCIQCIIHFFAFFSSSKTILT